MAQRKSGAGGRIPVGLLITGGHIAFDLISEARCPNCGSQVVLYICTECKKPVWPNRRRPGMNQ